MPPELPPAPSPSAPAFGLTHCIAPLPIEEFFARVWERDILHCVRNDAAYFASLFGMKDINDYLAAARRGPKIPPIHVTNARKNSAVKVYRPDGAVDADAVNAAYRAGDTLIFNGMRQTWIPVAGLCRDLEATFQHSVGANLYLTPPQSQGFNAHFDTHEVLVLQLNGSKLWRIYHQEMELPLESQFHHLDLAHLPPPSHELLLNPGDTLYIPRGRVHEALSTDSSSMHLSIGIHVTRWYDLVHSALRQFADRDVSLRRTVPVGALFSKTAPEALAEKLRALLEEFADQTPAREAIAQAQKELLTSLPPFAGS